MFTDTHLFVMQKRVAGYTHAVDETGIDCHCIEIDRNDYTEDIKEKLELALSENPDIDGFFFATHYLAEETLRFLLNAGTDYRSKYGFACIHSSKALDILCPEMTKAIMPIDEMGETAVNIIMENIRDKNAFKFQNTILKNHISGE